MILWTHSMTTGSTGRATLVLSLFRKSFCTSQNSICMLGLNFPGLALSGLVGQNLLNRLPSPARPDCLLRLVFCGSAYAGPPTPNRPSHIVLLRPTSSICTELGMGDEDGPDAQPHLPPSALSREQATRPLVQVSVTPGNARAISVFHA